MLNQITARLRGPNARGVLGTLLVRVLSVVLAFASMTLLGRSLGSAGYGIFAGTLSIANLCAFGSRLGVEALLVRTVAEYHAKQRPALIRGVMIYATGSTFILTLIAIAALLSAATWCPQLLGPYADTAWLAALMILPVAMISVAQGALRGLMRFVIAYVPAFVLMHATQLALLIALVFAGTLNPPNALMSTNIAWYFAMLVSAIFLWRATPGDVRGAPTEMRARQWTASSAFTALGMTQVILIGQADVFLIGLLADASEAGRYAAGQRIAWLLMIPVMAVYAGLNPTVAALFAAKSHHELAQRVRTGARLTLALALLIAIPLAGLGARFFAFLGPEFAESYVIYVVLAGGVCVALAFGRAFEILVMTGHAKIAGLTSLTAMSCNLMADILVIPGYGALGAATATALILVLESAVLCVLAWRLIEVRCDVAGFRG